jgi:thiol-disulfide isomerase/thioredoxin
MNHRLVAVSLVAAAFAAVGIGASQPAGKPKEAPAASGDQPKWPAYKTKKLYADDWRGKKAPEFVVGEMLGDKPKREGKVVLIDFWATWCPPCREAIPELNDLQAKFKDDLVVIGISDEKPETVRAFMKKTPMKYAQAIDTQGRMKKTLNVGGIPHVIIISTDGVIRWQGYPLSDEERLTEEVVRSIIAADPGLKHKPGSSTPPKDKPAEGKPSEDTKPKGKS